MICIDFEIVYIISVKKNIIIAPAERFTLKFHSWVAVEKIVDRYYRDMDSGDGIGCFFCSTLGLM